MPARRLSAQEASFVYGECQRIPLNVGCLALLDAGPLRDDDGSIDLDRMRRRLAARLHRVPVFRQKLAEIPLGGGRPVWIDDPGFRIEDHVQLVALPRPGSRAQLLELMGRIQSGMLNRERPLWDLTFVDGLAGGERVALIARVHHALVDGAAGMALAALLFDGDDERQAAPAWEPEPEPDGWKLLSGAAREHGRDLLDRARSVAEGVRRPTGPLNAIGGVARALGNLLSGFDALPFNARVGPRRAFELVDVPLKDVLLAKRAAGATVNDVVLGAVSGALRRYLAQRGFDADEPRRLKTLCPVDVRRAGDDGPGSQVSVMFVELPVDEPDPLTRVECVGLHARGVKNADISDGAQIVSRVTSLLPVPMLRATSWYQFRGLMANANLMVSNIRGPAEPFHCFDAQVDGFFPYFGVQDGLGLNLVLMSYAGRLQIGCAADPDLVPDLDAFAEALGKSFAELAAAV